MIAKGKVDHPFLGIQMAAITPELKAQLRNNAKNLEVTEDKGVLIVDVVPNSPADKANLKSGDVIQAINDKAVSKPDEVQQAVAKTKVGYKLPVQLKRDGKRLNLEVEVGVLPVPQTTNR